MAPIIHCVRHAQGFHNLTTENHIMRDPSLTDLGNQQCKTLSEVFPNMDAIDLIVASPIRRTLYTALQSFGPVIQSKNLKVIALPELQETSDLPCDTGSDVEKLQEEFKDKPVDLALVKEGWNRKDVDSWAAPQVSKILARAKVARQWLKSRSEKNIVVVTHGGYLHYFTDDWAGISNWTAGSGWANTEFRSYQFKPEANDVENSVELIETSESRERRRGTEKPLTEAEQRNLRATGIATWISLGYIKGDPAEIPGNDSKAQL